MSEKLAEGLASPPWEALERVGEGATSEVWRARHPEHPGQVVALKLARRDRGARAPLPPWEAVAALAWEAMVLARVGRRWGPALIDAGAGFLATEWVDGAPVNPRALAGGVDREKLAAVVAHGAARALEELHAAGVRHGDVKPQNVLRADHYPSRDTADDWGATLIDLGLAAEVGAPALGGTPRYAAPELRDRGEAGPTANLWALGVVLAEILDPRVAEGADPVNVIARVWTTLDAGGGEPARWVRALIAHAPGGRPSAQWLASRAAHWMGLTADPQEASSRRVHRVRRTYLAARLQDIAPRARVSRAIAEPARGWLEDAVRWQQKLQPSGASASEDAPFIEPLGPVRRARWLVTLIGPSAAAWPLGSDPRGEGELVERAVALARERDPSGWTLADFSESAGRTARREWQAWSAGSDDDRIVRVVRELARAAPDPAALDQAENELARGRASGALALALAAALTRSGETGRAWAALAMIEGQEADALRAELARRRGQTHEAEGAARRALIGKDTATRWAAQATLARLAWDGGDLDEAERRLEGALGPAAAEVRALIGWRRGSYEPALRALEMALAEPHDGDVVARLEGARGLLELARGGSAAALRSFGRAVELATRAGAVLEEATYLTSEAAAATDAGDLTRALASATRAALLWERLGRPDRAARAWLARAGSLATLGVAHGADEAAEEALARALASHDGQAAAYARWAQVEVRPPATTRRAPGRSRPTSASARRRRRTAHARRRAFWSGRPGRWRTRASPPWTPWRRRCRPRRAGNGGGHGLRPSSPAAAPTETPAVLGALMALIDAPAPLGSRGPALDAAVRLATERGDGDAARRLEHARQLAARALRDQTPPNTPPRSPPFRGHASPRSTPGT